MFIVCTCRIQQRYVAIATCIFALYLTVWILSWSFSRFTNNIDGTATIPWSSQDRPRGNHDLSVPLWILRHVGKGRLKKGAHRPILSGVNLHSRED